MLKLNMWHRLGIVFTALWVLGSGTYWLGKLSKCTSDAPWFCDFIEASGGDAPLPAALWAAARALGFERMGVAGNAVFIVAVIPALAWFAALAAKHVARWVWAGRRISS
jgi:hypothetical protein